MQDPKGPCGWVPITPIGRGSNWSGNEMPPRDGLAVTPTCRGLGGPEFREERVTPTYSRILPWEYSRVDTITPSHSPSFRTGVGGSESESKSNKIHASSRFYRTMSRYVDYMPFRLR